MNRRVARIKAVQSLYQIDMTGVENEEAIDAVLEEDEEVTPFLQSLVKGTVEHTAEIDEALNGAMEHWTIGRVANVNRAIMRMAVYEMKWEDDIPVNVSLNEAIELAKGFSADEESGRFVNGVLSKIAEGLPKE
ncbi:transcription antitermination factor NusB [Alteribacter natronophilus]|uniref:transcription antitermination factor NusB n=1 Tax=Alteribacter natronophilus TaxID=2583810 RepID=UPI00110E26B6|nr:transcription antitermination factor NusB [Alteribacter natronophilus]TMW73746.1 transcription antitermination factor NusB [Alteribacter natronophilus]